jgi:hypothetical protein
VELREIRNEEGNRLPRIVRRESGSVLTWRRAQVLVLAAQRMPPARIAELVFSDPDTVRELLPNFNREGFDALYPRYRGGRARRFRLPERQQIKRVALRVPSDLGQPFATWSLAKLADYLVAEEVLADSSHAGLRQLLRQEGVGLQALRTWKRSNEPEFAAKKNRILELYAIADGLAEPGPGAPKAVVCSDEFGPLTIQPQPGGKAWAPRAKPRRIRATDKRPHGIRPLLCTLEVAADLLSGEVAAPKTRVEFLALCAQIASRYPSEVRLALLLDNVSPTKATQWEPGPPPTTPSSPTPLLRLLAQPDRAPGQRPALLLPRGNRPPRPANTNQAQQRLHHLALPQPDREHLRRQRRVRLQERRLARLGRLRLRARRARPRPQQPRRTSTTQDRSRQTPPTPSRQDQRRAQARRLTNARVPGATLREAALAAAGPQANPGIASPSASALGFAWTAVPQPSAGE